MKKIIITGGIGYIGMELAKLYSGISRYNNITVLDKDFYASRVGQLRRWGLNYHQVDILDKKNLKNYLSDADLIYHLAGITNVPTTNQDKSNFSNKEINSVGVNGTKNIINLSSRSAKIVFPSTHVIFEGIQGAINNIDENFIPKPKLEYAKGKFSSELDLINSQKNYVILRLGSVYGLSYDSMRLNIMPNLFSKSTALNGQIKLFNGGKQIKSMVNVIDVARCMYFVGESENINYDVFNCVNESLTVKQVAEICKKYNSELKIISTKDMIPNGGYSLSNSKIKKEGFKFLYNIEDSIKEMLDAWKQNKLPNINEKIDYGQDQFIDHRGIISNFHFEDNINMIGYVESLKNTIRGNHFHPVQTQKCLLIKGRYLSITKDLLNKNSSIEIKLISEGELSTIPPNVAHTMIFLEDSIFLNLVNGNREHSKFDISHTLKYELVNNDFATSLTKIYKSKCRVCNNKKLYSYLSLGLSPLANNLLNNKNETFENYPLELNWCSVCYNSQLSVVIPRNKMFKNYLYLSSTTSSFRKHFENIAKEIVSQFKLNKNSFVIDVGSNDGIFLKPLTELKIKNLGIEPAKNIAKIANQNGLNTISTYLNKKTVNEIISKNGKADIVTAFNVFAHNDNLYEMMTNVGSLLKNNGVFIFEVQYFLNTIKDLTFDNIYHEHVNYWCVLSLLKFFEKSELTIYKISEIDTHGGSIRVYASKNPNKKVHSSVNEFIKLERKNGLDKLDTYLNFSQMIVEMKNQSVQKINNLIENKKTLIGYGAPAKATTVLNYFGLSNSQIKYVIDDNTLKHNKFIPGTSIQIKNLNDIIPTEYDNVIVLAWNFYNEIKKRNTKVFSNAEFLKLK